MYVSITIKYHLTLLEEYYTSCKCGLNVRISLLMYLFFQR